MFYQKNQNLSSTIYTQKGGIHKQIWGFLLI